MKRHHYKSIVFALAALSSSAVWAQQKQMVSYSIPPGVSLYTQENIIEVGDVPGHQVRVFEVHTDYQNVGLAFDGVKVKESWVRGASDYTNGTGTSSNYSIFLLEDGNKLFTKDAVVGHATSNPDGSKALKYSIVNTFIGGTGKFRGIRGQLRTNAVRIAGSKTATTEVSGEYWLEK